MLIEFSVKNFRSIRDEALFSMVKGAGNELKPMSCNLRMRRRH
jgi:AAA15 family ATPase/GTPase